MTPPTAPAPRAARPRGADAAVLAGLAVLCALVYGRVHAFPFLDFDDPHFTTGNPMVRDGLTWRGLLWALSTFHTANWHPLTWLSHQLDMALFGGWAGGHHATSAVLHTANALLLFLALRRLTGARWRSAAVAALFAAHPLHVESVAWVSERKDLLAALFFLLALLAYPRSLAAGPPRLAAPLALLALGLLAKPTVVTLPLVLLVLDRWPLGRVTGASAARRAIAEKAPLLLLGGAGALLAVVAQHSAGAVQPLSAFTLGARWRNAALSAISYLEKTVLPRDLAVFYPHPGDAAPLVPALLALAALALVSVAAWRLRARRPWLLAGWLWFAVTIAPVIGLVQVGEQALADRYTYLPLVGVFVALVWGLAAAAGESPRRRAAASVAFLAVLALLAVAARRQVSHWESGVRLFTHARDVLAEESPRVLLSLAIALDLEGRKEEGLRTLQRYLELQPDDARARFVAGTTLLASGRLREAVRELAAAVRLSPADAAYRSELGFALALLGSKAAAERHLREAVRLRPADPVLRNRLGCVLAESGRASAAAAEFREALRLEPGYAEAAANLRLLRGEGN